MKYISTRSANGEGVSSAYAIKRGLADDGGLYMPQSIPKITDGELRSLLGMDYCERAAFIIGNFLTDYSHDELLGYARLAYSKAKFGDFPAPVHKIDEKTYSLELWHGPTCAFKDMALQIMPHLFVGALKKTGESRDALILVATSGDTGKAALEGYRDVEGTKIQVFYPTDGVSAMQKLQMQTQEGSNLSVLGIRGNFDDAQSGVKRIFSDPAIASMLNGEGVFLSSANSINWGRLVPQIVYYFSAYLDMVNSGEIRLGERIDICVPTGNFGNIFAAYVSKLMGLPIEKLVCASNENNVLTDFLSNGKYDKNRSFKATISPSMDILISSNLERLLYTVAGPDATRGYMRELSEHGCYTVSDEVLATIRESFIGIYADEEETKKTIKRVFYEKNYLIDTHTSVAACAAMKYMSAYEAERKILVVSTASPYKFAKDVYASLTDGKQTDDIGAPEALSSLTGTSVPAPLASLRDKAVLHPDTIEKDGMDNAVMRFVRE